ncbi:MAG TPA: delta-60 repeat domain-containing protein [Verrucomicrobiae bacterium]|nr:delta-60 repeat domain-containing protein [Verrucomicrobiae bacterium]
MDPSFLSGMTGPNSWLWAGALQSDGKLLLGGQFTSFNGVPRGPVARLNVDGSVDTNFSASVTAGEPTIHSVAVQPDGKVLVGGMFTGMNGAPRFRLARLNADELSHR